jgi:hypothetical protein
VTAADDKDIARLRTAHPAWEIWYVPTAAPPWIWCAKRLDDRGTTTLDDQGTTTLINTRSPAHLEQEITEAEQEHRA